MKQKKPMDKFANSQITETNSCNTKSRASRPQQGPGRPPQDHAVAAPKKKGGTGTPPFRSAHRRIASKAEMYSLDAADLQHCGPDDDALVPWKRVQE